MIKNAISNIRKDLGITQEQLANDLNVSRQTIIGLENNKNNISLELAFEISKYFDKEINEVFYESYNNDSEIDQIRNTFGKNTIIIKDNLVFRCSTEVLEIGPSSLYELELPPYGKMKKFIVLNNRCFELIPTRDYNSRTDLVKHTIGNEINLEWSSINFDETSAWNYKNRI